MVSPSRQQETLIPVLLLVQLLLAPLCQCPTAPSDEPAAAAADASQPPPPPPSLAEFPLPLVDDEPGEQSRAAASSGAPTTGETASTPPEPATPHDTATTGAAAATPTVAPAPPRTSSTQARCVDDNYCLNGGTCVTNEHNQMTCICPEGFSGARCQTRNICQTPIVAGLTGNQICARIGRECENNDKFFRCACLDNEYFIFKINQTGAESGGGGGGGGQRAPTGEPPYEPASSPGYPTFALGIEPEASTLAEEDSADGDGAGERRPLYSGFTATPAAGSGAAPAYLAECRAVDRCLGVRCRRLSEVCRKGSCVCSQESGYSRDPKDGRCKLINRCLLALRETGGGAGSNQQPICGEARCVATFDQSLYRCSCPIGYKAVQNGPHKSSTRCVLMADQICEVPLLNKCQHLCHVDTFANKYRCSCLRGYKPGARPGVDDHLCFFDDGLEQPGGGGGVSSSSSGSSGYDYRQRRESPGAADKRPRRPNEVTFSVDPHQFAGAKHEPGHLLRTVRRTVYRDLPWSQAGDGLLSSASGGGGSTGAGAGEPPEAQQQQQQQQRKSAQDRCNMYCEENKICVLEDDFSYRCTCDRQGFVSVGDRCLNWCAAAEFSYKLRDLLERVCLSGSCRPTNSQKSSPALERDSSWRPTFECDCSSSPLLVQDPESRLCKLDFKAILAPCQPGNVGYKDCVESKNAYCAVLYRPSQQFLRGLQKDFPEAPAKGPGAPGAEPPDYDDIYDDLEGAGNQFGPLSQDALALELEAAAAAAAEAQAERQPEAQPDAAPYKTSKAKAKAKPAKDKLYACVCSPEKKFLVDKPRNKARCINECDLLNNECGRFNRMCRAATIAPDDRAGRRNLIRLGQDGARMDFKRTGCECLPGFNVGPYESLDFTLDDNNAGVPALHAGDPLGAATPHVIPPPVPYLGTGRLPDDSEHPRAKYMNINSRCLLDFDVVEFHASFKAPADFDPNWLRVRPLLEDGGRPAAPSDASPSGRLASWCRAATPGDSAQAPTPNAEEAAAAGEPNRTEPAGEDCPPEQPAAAAAADNEPYVLAMPAFMRADISELYKHVVLVAQCDPYMARLSLDTYQECIKYRYWIIEKLRAHFIDWRRVLAQHLAGTFDLMDGDIRLHIDKCEARLRHVSLDAAAPEPPPAAAPASGARPAQVDDEHAYIDADIDCALTLHSASDASPTRQLRKVLLEKQLHKFIFGLKGHQLAKLAADYYLMAPNVLIRRDSVDSLAEHKRSFNPCESDYAYCDQQTKCEMVDIVNYTCTCETGYTPIGSRDIYLADSRKEVCEDINECLFDVCKELANVSTCINEIGDYKCHCNRHYIGDNKKFCTHVCNTIPCVHGKCRLVDDHHAFCQCNEGYKETDCSVQDPNVALRKANMIICGSIFTSVLLLAITFAISLNSELKKTKSKLKRLEALAGDTSPGIMELHQQQQQQQATFRTILK